MEKPAPVSVILRRSLLLVGMMGSGKSSASKLLADMLGAPRLSLDKKITAIAGKEIAAIFAEDGEVEFRSLESRVLAEAIASSDSELAIIDCGGGVVEADGNRRLINSADVDCCYLAAPAEVLIERVNRHPGSRPLLEGGDAEAKLEGLLARRGSWYQDVADVTIDASKNQDEVVAAIIDHLSHEED